MNKIYIQFLLLTLATSMAMLLVYKFVAGTIDVGVTYAMTMIAASVNGRWMLEQARKQK